MKILLINPSLVEANIGHYKAAAEKQRGIYPSLGLGYIAAVLEKRGDEVKIIDCDAEGENYPELIEKIIESFQPDLAGFYVMTWTFRRANELAKFIKSKKPEIKLIAGGPGVTCLPIESLEYGEFEFGVVSEGEITILELVKALEEKKKDFSEILGLVYKENGKIKINPPRPLIEDLDSLPFPSRHLLPIYKYFDVLTRKKNFATLIATRGCPFNCSFCDRKNRMGREWRVRSPKNLIDEVEKIYRDYGLREFMFFDDNFVVRKDWVYEVCDEIKKRNLKILWECRARVDTVDEPLLKAMKKAGCYRIRFGFESGDNGILKVLKKGITVEQSLECARACRAAGMEMVGYFMMGSPEETEETLQKTLGLALKIDPSFAVFSKTILIPGSELFEWGVSEGYLQKNYWEKFLLGEEKNGAPSIDAPGLSEKVVDKYIKEANKKFYLRPKYMLKKLFGIRSFYQLWRQLRMAKDFLLN